MNDLWQSAVALSAVALAAGWIARRGWLAWRSAVGGQCGGCGSCAAQAGPPTVSLEALAASSAKLPRISRR
jgi:hypothetical protein